MPEALAVVATSPANTPSICRGSLIYIGLISSIFGGSYEIYTRQLKIEDLAPDKVEDLTALHLSIEYWAETFCRVNLTKFSSLPAKEYHDLSPIERGRLLRAFYRFPILQQPGWLHNHAKG